MRAIVTGGAGFIGSNLVDGLLARGDQVTVIDDLSTGRRENLDGAIERGARLCPLDIRDAAALAGVVEQEKPDAIFHLAAQIDVRRSLADPAWDSSINVGGTINVLEAARIHGVARVVNTSTGGAIYGDAQTIPSDEQTPPLPEAAYGQSKLAAEGYLGLYERLYGLSSVTLRYGNVYGPRQDPSGEAGVIAIFIGKFLAGQGVRIDSDGEQTRDYVYVGDVAEANVRALESGGGGCYVIGTGRKTSVNALYRELVAIMGVEPPVEHGPKRPGDVRDAQFDATLARKELGWTPRTKLREGMEQTVAFFRGRAAQ